MGNFDTIRALIIDPEDFSRNLLCSQLAHLGLKEIGRQRKTEEALVLMRREHFDVIFCDEAAGGIAEFMYSLRRDLSTCNIYVPVMLVALKVQEQQIAFARDSGMYDVIVKPVSAATIDRKLNACLYAPRNFVNTKTYVGPDRRTGANNRRSAQRVDNVERRGQSSDPVTITPIPPVRLD